MYSTDGGDALYHTKNHILRFMIFFSLMIFLSFVNIKFWHATGYVFYIVVLLLLIGASFYGVTAQGSQRWINLYFINLQPSELMKIAIIVCFAKYYHRVQINNVNKIISLAIPLVILFVQLKDCKDPEADKVMVSNKQIDVSEPANKLGIGFT